MKKLFITLITMALIYGAISLIVGAVTGDMMAITWVGRHKLLLTIAICLVLSRFMPKR